MISSLESSDEAVSKPVVILETLLALALSSGCATTIHVPAAAVEPAAAVVVTHGISSSLILPNADGAAFRWAFGDWRYYAEGHTGFFSSIAAGLWPTPAALGRQTIERAPRDPVALAGALGIVIDEIHVIHVERQAIERLQRRLQTTFERGLDSRLYNPEPNLEFVRVPLSYTLLSNSNTQIGDWLRELGCDVSGFPLLARWRIRGKAADGLRDRDDRGTNAPQLE
ncbi:MAG TPA: hypothetical protein VMT00_09970 [Thermoanaerobaculia bacterium]|nr:hypothetical protein [Thermoanaerobaculia bacterium]